MTQRLPPWLRRRLPGATAVSRIQERTYAKGLHTVCREARCPNQRECYEKGTATFLILGDLCTRDCGFCAVKHGRPSPPDPLEPKRVADAVIELGLTHAVITSVTRDDLPDGGAAWFAETIAAIRETAPGVTVETLIPDFLGSEDALRTVLDAAPEVINHNMETVRRLYPAFRGAASYDRSLELLRRVNRSAPEIITKSGIMVGVGETVDEVLELVRDLLDAGCRVLTIGQYLQPTRRLRPVKRYLTPEEFDDLRERALSEGMKEVAAGPSVRSSYRAGTLLERLARADVPDSSR